MALSLQQDHQLDYELLVQWIPTFQKNMLRDHGITMEYHHRLKSVRSIETHLQKNSQKEFRDIIGLRITNPWTVHLHTIKKYIQKELKIKEYIITEQNRVIHMYGKTIHDHWFEIQLWTNLIYHCFEYEHNIIYKPIQKPHEDVVKKSNLLRKQQHALQDRIDEHLLVPY